MSLEISIQNLADAIRYAADRIAGGNSTGQVAVVTDAPAATESAPAANARAAIAAAKKAADDEKARVEAKRVADELEAKEAAELTGGITEAVVLDYAKDVQPQLGELLKKDKAALVELLAKFGAKNGAGLKVADYHAVLEAIAAKLA